MRRRTVRAALATLAAALALACRTGASSDATPPSALARDVAYLGSPRLAGRGVDTPGSRGAASYIAREYQRLGLAGAFAQGALYQPFPVDGLTGRNIAVVVPGADSALRARYVVVGAHYDHLGRSDPGAPDEARGPVVHPGADDNASGSAAVLELARRLAARPAPRSVLLVHFDAEERGLVGSRAFVARPPVAREAIALMVNLDMVGRLRGGPLAIETPGAPHLRATIDSAVTGAGVRAAYTAMLNGRSDHSSFAEARIPAVTLFTGFHGDYHTPSDVVSRLDLPGLSRVVDVAEAVVRGRR